MSQKKSTLLNEAIADAKELQKLAMKQAKESITEVFMPQIKDMVSASLQEGLEEETSSEEMYEKKSESEIDKENGLDKVNEKEFGSTDDKAHDKPMDEKSKKSSEEKSSEDTDEALDLEALLKELESESGEDEKKSEMDEKKKSSEEKSSEEKIPGSEDAMKESESDEQPDQDDDVQYEEYLKLKDKFEKPKAKSGEGEGGEEETDFDIDEDMDLKTLLAELEKSSEDEKKSEMDEKKFAKSEKDTESDAHSEEPLDEEDGKFKAWVDKLKAGGKEVFDNLKKDFESIKDPKQRAEWLKSLSNAFYSSAGHGLEEKKDMEKLKSELNEVNLLNAKLLYFNRLVKDNDNLNRAQKVNFLKQFDKAGTVKETKLVYSAISESLKSAKPTDKTKKQLKESVSFASKAAGNSTAKKTVITEDDSNDDVIPYSKERWQTLAGIKNSN